LRSLQERGHIRVRHGSGAFVAEPATSAALRQRFVDEEVSLRELYDMRDVIELPAAEWAARRQDPERLAAVRAAYAELEAASRAFDIDFARLQELDAAFHLRIVEAAGNRFLSQTLGVLQEILATGMSTTLTIPGRLERSRRDHERDPQRDHGRRRRGRPARREAPRGGGAAGGAPAAGGGQAVARLRVTRCRPASTVDSAPSTSRHACAACLPQSMRAGRVVPRRRHPVSSPTAGATATTARSEASN
jgi:hypothetical protein